MEASVGIGEELYGRLAQTLDVALSSKITGMLLEGVGESALTALLAGPQSGLDEMVTAALDSIDNAALESLKTSLAMSEGANGDMGSIPWVSAERSLQTGEVPVECDVSVRVWLREPICVPFTAHVWLKGAQDEAYSLVGTLSPELQSFDMTLKQGAVRVMVSLAAHGSQAASPSGKAKAMAGQIRGRESEQLLRQATQEGAAARSRVLSWADAEDDDAVCA